MPNVGEDEAKIIRWKAGMLKRKPVLVDMKSALAFLRAEKMIDRDGCLTGIAWDWLDFDRTAV